MMSGLPFSVVTGLLYPFAVVATCTGLASWLAMSPAYSDFIRGRSQGTWARDGVVAGLVLCLGAALSFRPIPHFAGIVGYFGSFRASSVAGGVLGLFMLAVGWPVESAMVCMISAPLGGALSYLGRYARSVLVLWGGALVPLSWWLGWIPEVSLSHVRDLTPTQLSWMVFALSLSSALQSAVLLWVLEYLAGREERRGADVLWRMSEMFDGILASLREPLPNPSLCEAVSRVLRADCMLVLPTGEVASSRPMSTDGEMEAVVEEVMSRGEPCIRSRSAGGKVIALALDDGEERLGVLVLPIPERHLLSRAGIPLLRALSALFTSELAAQRIQRQQSALEQAHYRMLVAQIRPHFLYNSLTSVASLTESDPRQAHDLLLDLARSLRNRFAGNQDWSSLGSEMEGLYSYLGVEKARYGERLKLSVDVPPSLFGQRVPAMLIQPLMENAIRHGVAPNVDGGAVRLRIGVAEGRLRVSVEDDGVGFGHPLDGDGEGVDSRVVGSGTFIGLANVRQRLRTLLGPDCDFHIRSSPGAGTVISFSLPVEEEHEESSLIEAGETC